MSTPEVMKRPVLSVLLSQGLSRTSRDCPWRHLLQWCFQETVSGAVKGIKWAQRLALSKINPQTLLHLYQHVFKG
jgi:hypothetical protein